LEALSNSARIQEAAPPIPSPLGSGSESVWRVLKLARTKIDRWIRSTETPLTISLISGSVSGAGVAFAGSAAPAREAMATAMRIMALARMVLRVR
jgi:hypothetical protein